MSYSLLQIGLFSQIAAGIFGFLSALCWLKSCRVSETIEDDYEGWEDDTDYQILASGGIVARRRKFHWKTLRWKYQYYMLIQSMFASDRWNSRAAAMTGMAALFQAIAIFTAVMYAAQKGQI